MPSPLMPDTVLAPASRARLRHRTLLFVAVCSAIAFLLWTIQGGALAEQAVYSFAVGACCWLFITVLRAGAGYVRNLRRRWLELPTLAEPGPGLVASVPLLALGALAGAPLGLWLGDMLTGGRSPNLMNLQSPATRVTLAITTLATVVITFAVTARERLAEARAAAEAAKRSAAEAQLKLLESQLEPHMLFNTLANLRVLIGIDPARAQVMLDRLIAFLRATLSASRSDTQTLAAEFERVADYLALMSLRMGPRLVVKLDLPEALRNATTPPLLLQPLVENSIRHGLEPQVAAGRVEVSASAANGQLVLTVRDTGVGLGAATAAGNTGFGLEQIRARLAALHGSAASLTLVAAADAEGGTLATVHLPLSKSKPA